MLADSTGLRPVESRSSSTGLRILQFILRCYNLSRGFMAKLSIKEVEHIAKLARIHLSDKEKQKYSKELSSILGYVEKLQKVNTDNVEETSQVTGLTNVYSEDKTMDDWKVDKDIKKNREKLLSNAPARKDDYIKVRQVLE